MPAVSFAAWAPAVIVATAALRRSSAVMYGRYEKDGIDDDKAVGTLGTDAEHNTASRSRPTLRRRANKAEAKPQTDTASKPGKSDGVGKFELEISMNAAASPDAASTFTQYVRKHHMSYAATSSTCA